MNSVWEERCFTCKFWYAIEDVPGVSVHEHIAARIAALERKKKSGDLDGYISILHGLSTLSGFCYRHPPRRRRGSRVTPALKVCEDWVHEV